VFSAAAASIDDELRQRLCADRKFLLPGKQDDLDGHLLCGRTGSHLPE
jgi:hypothetical protein